MGPQINVQISQVKVQKLFIGQLADDATNQEIAELFERFGAKVTSALIYSQMSDDNSSSKILTIFKPLWV